MSPPNRSAVFWGTLSIIVGVVFLLNNFNLVPEGIRNWWPLLVMGAGIWLLGQSLARRRGGGLVGGIVVLSLGVFWLLQSFGRVDDRAFLPVLLIAAGGGLLLQNLYQRR